MLFETPKDLHAQQIKSESIVRLQIQIEYPNTKTLISDLDLTLTHG